MKISDLKYGLLTWLSSLTTLVILLMPFHAFLTVWLASELGHYTAVRLWKEVLLLICCVGALVLVAIDHKIRSHTLSRRLVWTIFAYLAVTLVWGLVAYAKHGVTGKALGYGLIVDLRFLAFFLVTWALSLRLSRMHDRWQWLVLWPSVAVIAFGLLQVFVLPHDFLKHFGYGPHTIDPFETINHNANYIRIMATTRGANPLGAYLIVPISFLSVLLMRRHIQRRQLALLFAALVTLFFTFSRSAWIGAAITLAVAFVMCVQNARIRRYVLYGAGILVLFFAGLFAGLHDNSRFQNFVFHTEDKSAVAHSSNEGHLSALQDGVSDIAHHPLGEGTGTAGPASVYNTGHQTRIAENFYVQIGQETGVIGLVLFLVINAGTGMLLWMRRQDALAVALFASLLGISFVNLLSHAWADDTLAYIWWGLAGIAMAPDPRDSRTEQKDNEPKPAKTK